jgi:hypothetical protein
MAACRGARFHPAPQAYNTKPGRREGCRSSRELTTKVGRAADRVDAFKNQKSNELRRARSRSDRAPDRRAGPPGLAPEALPARFAALAGEDLRTALRSFLCGTALERYVGRIRPGLATQRIAGAARGIGEIARHRACLRKGPSVQGRRPAEQHACNAGRTIAHAWLDRSAEQRCFPLPNPRVFTPPSRLPP